MKILPRDVRRIATLRHEIRRHRVEISRVHEDGFSNTHARRVDRLETAKARIHRLRSDAER